MSDDAHALTARRALRDNAAGDRLARILGLLAATSGALRGATRLPDRQMDEITQQNAALVQQTNAAIVQIEAHVAELDAAIRSVKCVLLNMLRRQPSWVLQ